MWLGEEFLFDDVMKIVFETSESFFFLNIRRASFNIVCTNASEVTTLQELLYCRFYYPPWN